MTITITLSEADIREAIRLYLAGQGWRALDGAAFTVSPGDRPGEGATITATVGARRHPAPCPPGDPSDTPEGADR